MDVNGWMNVIDGIDLFRKYARGGGRPKTVVLQATQPTFGALADQSKANSSTAPTGATLTNGSGGDDISSPTIARSSTTVSGPGAANGDDDAQTTASTLTTRISNGATGNGNGNDDDVRAEISSSRIGHLTMNAARRSHSELRSGRRQRSHIEESESQPGRTNSGSGNNSNRTGAATIARVPSTNGHHHQASTPLAATAAAGGLASLATFSHTNTATHSGHADDDEFG
jgi:hypothetical protein